MWKFLVKQQKIEVLEREVIADHQISFVNLKFTFDGDWKKFHKVVQFSQCDEVYSIVLGFDGASCKLPAELHAGAVKMSVFGYDAESDTTVRATTVPITLNIRPSGFVGDDDTPIPPTPDLYTQLLQKISEIQSGVNGKDGLSAYELAQQNGFAGTLAEWLESLKGADGHDGIDGVTPDMSEYPKTTAVENMIETQLAPILESGHAHENKDILDAATASYTTEEQQKLSRIDPADYATKEELEQESLSIREAMIPLTRELHSHQNKDTLDALTPELFADLQSLQQFEDSTKYEIQTIKESVDPIISQAHWHHNLTFLNSITAEKIAKWDGISDFELRLQSLRDDVMDYQMQMNYRMENADNDIAEIQSDIQQLRDSLQYDQQNQNDAILTLENRITILESQISSGNNAVTLFSAGSNAVSKYGDELFIIYNNAYNSIADFSANYPHFLSADNDYQMCFSTDDFGWDGVVYVVCTKELNLSESSQISMCYKSGATENGDMYLVPIPEHSDVPISVYVYTQIQNGTAIKVPFQWLQSETHITTLSDCSVGNGTYYFAFAGRSNNTHPMIKSIKILGGN